MFFRYNEKYVTAPLALAGGLSVWRVSVNRWRQLPDRLVRNIGAWRIGYMMCFAVYATIANLDTSPNAAWVAWGYILLSVFALIVVLPHIRRVLFRTWDPLRSRMYVGKPVALLKWRLYLYILTPIAFIALLELFSILESLFLQFTQTNVSTKAGVMDYVIALLAGLEELWRWSMIGTVVIVCRWLTGDSWRHGRVRAAAFTLAVILSSLAFGAGHILEFSHSRLQAWYLFSGLGLLLALMAVVTGRILLVIAVHSGYDLWITWVSSTSAPTELWALLMYGVLVLWIAVVATRRHFGFRPPAQALESVVLSDLPADWSELFAIERHALNRVFANRAMVHIRHIGATALPFGTANGVIDILVELSRPRVTPEEHAQLERLGYQFCGNAGIKGRLYWIKNDEVRCHLQIVKAGGRLAKTAVDFTNLLRSRDDLLQEYSFVKRQLVAQGFADWASYTEAKRPAVEDLLRRLRYRRTN